MISGILAGIYSDFFFLAFYLPSIQAFILAFYLASILVFFLAFYLASIQAFILVFYLASILTFFLAVEVQRCSTRSEGPRLRSSGAH